MQPLTRHTQTNVVETAVAQQVTCRLVSPSLLPLAKKLAAAGADESVNESIGTTLVFSVWVTGGRKWLLVLKPFGKDAFLEAPDALWLLVSSCLHHMSHARAEPHRRVPVRPG